MKDGVKLVNDLAHQLAISDVHLSMENSRALEQINIRWKQLQVEKSGVSHGEASIKLGLGGNSLGSKEVKGH